MSPLAQSIADLLIAAIALWFLFDPGFDPLPARGIANAVALFVIASSGWRIWRRHRGAK